MDYHHDGYLPGDARANRPALDSFAGIALKAPVSQSTNLSSSGQPRGANLLAAAFHGFYHDCYVVGDGVAPELTQARLWLTEAARIGLHTGLDVIGVSAPETM